jgi:formate dehydrogenase subunit gamma
MPFEAWDDVRGKALIAAHGAKGGAMLPILHALQAEFGHVPEPAIPMIADALNLSRAEVHGVVSFYHDFRREPAGRHVLKLCRAEACQAMGADDLADQARRDLGLDWGGATADRRLTLEPVFCLGLCAVAPAAMLDGRLVGRLDAAKLDRLLEQAA